MRQKNVLLTCALSLIAALSPAIEAAAQTTIGWTNGTHKRTSGVSFGSTTTQGMAIKLPKEKAELLKGEKIASVYAAFCSSRMSSITLFITEELGGESLYTQSVSSLSSSWSTYSLSTPYEITGDEIYIGFTYSLSTSYSSLSFDGTNGFEGTTYVYNDGSWEDAYDYGYGSGNIKLTLEDTKEFVDAVVSVPTLSGFYKAGTAYDIEGCEVFNFGSVTITSLDFTYTVGDGETKTLTLTDLSIESGSIYDVTVEGLTVDESGSYDITFTASSVNGGEPDDEPSDNSGSATQYFYPADASKTVLVENMTTQQCTNCPTGHRVLQAAIEGRDDVAVIAHHSGYYTDAFTMTEDVNMLYFFEDGSYTFAPAFMIDRYRTDSQSSVYGGPPFYTTDSDVLVERIEERAAEQPYVSVTIDAAYNEDTGIYAGTVDVYTYTDTPKSTLYLNLQIVQDSIVASQTSGGDSYVHRHVFRGTIGTGTFGIPFSSVAGETYSYAFEYEVPESIKSSYVSDYSETFEVVLKDMSLVAFVSDYSSSDYNDCIVYNADEQAFTENVTTGIQGVSDNRGATAEVYARNGGIYIAGDYDAVAVYDISGKLVCVAKGDKSHVALASGVYVVRISDANGTATKKYVVTNE